MDRNEILLNAGRAVKDRGDQYGSAESLFSLIADRWRLTIEQRHKISLSLTAEDVGLLMIDLKFARALAAPGHADNFVDLAGYGALLGELSTKPPLTMPKPVQLGPKPAPQLEDIDEAMKQVAAKFGANAKNERTS